MNLASAEQMREIDRRAVQEYGLPGVCLMENAGGAAARSAEELWLEAGASGPVVVLCGPGNNGGDGLVVARRLHNRGVPVRAFLAVATDKLKGEAALNCTLAKNFGIELTETPSRAALRRGLQGAGLVVDALLGTGLTGPVRNEIAAWIEAATRTPAPVLAVDIPSGISSETGQVMGLALPANRTVTFGLAKVGMYLFPGREYSGEIVVADISLPATLLSSLSPLTQVLTPDLAASALPGRFPDMHKGDAGRLLIVAGSPGMTGAAALAANAAVRAGAGLVYLAVPESLNAILEGKCTEPLTLPIAETVDGTLSPAAAEPILKRALDCDAVVLGPGLSRHQETAELARRLTQEIRVPLVVDADALNALSGQADLLLRRRGSTVLTPHPGEMTRLTGLSMEAVQADRLNVARRAADEWRCAVVLKGAGTVIAEPGGRAAINTTGNSGLASGGTGDILAGMLGAFLAGGRSPFEAAAAAVYYHGQAADLFAEEYASRALAASDLLEYLPLALREAEE
ncbi:MAG: NAD(P)H-hydrate dehydratase [candidate division WS1 bacterium]|jgi:NAD(P)H-hydrate epimerase|nr:NAD(P)H-hydrate dehydratase [candidate division WS1 bacterium]